MNNAMNKALENMNLRLATKTELTEAYSLALNSKTLLVMELAPYAGPQRAPTAAIDAIHLDIPVRKRRSRLP